MYIYTHVYYFFRCCCTLLYGVCDENDALHCRSSVFKPTVILYVFAYGDNDYMYVHWFSVTIPIIIIMKLVMYEQ